MKNKISILSILLILSSCSISEFMVNKRLYNKGFYVDFNNKHQKNVDDLTRISTKEFKISTVKNNENSNLTSSIVNEPHLFVQQTSKDSNLIVKKIVKLNKRNAICENSHFQKTNIDIKNNERQIKRLSLLSLISGFIGSLLIITILWGGLTTVFFIINMILSLLLIVSAIIFSLISFKKYKNSQTSKGKWMAIIGLSLGIISGVIWAFYSMLITIVLIFMR